LLFHQDIRKLAYPRLEKLMIETRETGMDKDLIVINATSSNGLNFQ
jgi:hypothetical protein